MADTHLRAIITAVDKLSPVLNKMSRNTRAWSREFEKAGRGAVPMALGLGVALAVPARAFMQAEDAATHLQNTLMTKDGISKGFEEISALAIDLGNKLPGTTADFYRMAASAKATGVNTETLAKGGLRAMAYLAVSTKELGVTYEQAAESVGQLGNAFGIADKDFVEFADTTQRALYLGTDLEQLRYGMARVAGPLKSVNMQGIKVAKSMIPLIAMFTRVGVSGEDAGTGIKKMAEVAISQNRFEGVETLVRDLEKMAKLPAAERLEKFSDLFGDPHAGKAMIIAAGGYKKMVAEMENLASLDQKIANSQKTLSFQWDSATGTLENLQVAFAKVYGEDMKKAAGWLNDLATKGIEWVTKNKPMISVALQMAGAFVGLKLAFMGVGVALRILSGIAKTNIFLLLLQAAVIAAPLIIAHWGEITAFFQTHWQAAIDWVSNKFTEFDNWVTGIGNGITSTFQQAADFFKGIWSGAIDWVSGKFSALAAIAGNIGSMFSGIGNMIPSANGMSLPGQSIQRKPIVSNSGFKGSLDINHVNAPQGFRASPVQSKGPVRVSQNVGYNWQVTGN